MAGKFELRARDVRGASARFVFGMANPAQRAIQVQYSPSGLLQLAFWSPERPVCYHFCFLARHNPKFLQNLLRILPGLEGRTARRFGNLPSVRSR